jgi:hypothetical protein
LKWFTENPETNLVHLGPISFCTSSLQLIELNLGSLARLNCEQIQQLNRVCVS